MPSRRNRRKKQDSSIKTEKRRKKKSFMNAMLKRNMNVNRSKAKNLYLIEEGPVTVSSLNQLKHTLEGFVILHNCKLSIPENMIDASNGVLLSDKYEGHDIDLWDFAIEYYTSEDKVDYVSNTELTNLLRAKTSDLNSMDCSYCGRLAGYLYGEYMKT